MRSASEQVEATRVVLPTVLELVVMIITTINIALWAFRPNYYGRGARARRLMGICTIVWVIFLPVASALSWGLGADGLASGQPGAWQGVVWGAVALACWPVAILALRKRRAHAAHSLARSGCSMRE